MSSKARRPYLMDKKSVTQFYQAPVRYLREIEARESEFEKPYVDDYYRPMHLDFPWPDFPPFPEIPPWPPLPPFEGPVPGLPGCAIVCYPPHNDCDNPVWCHPSIWCGSDIGCTLCTWVVEGAVAGYTPHHTGVGGWGIDIWIDEDLVEGDGSALITACMTDPCGNVCCQDIEISCKDCPPAVTFTWDDALSVDTLTEGNNGVITIAGGLSPYTWSLKSATGTGWSLGSSETAGVANTVAVAAGACGSAHIKVVDSCGTIIGGSVRCTDCNNSSWVLTTEDVCVLSGSGNCDSGYPTNYCTLLKGAGQQVQWSRNIGAGCCWATEALALAQCVAATGRCDVDAICHSDENIGCVNCIDSIHPIGYHPADCDIYEDASGWHYAKWCVSPRGYDYYLWKCA